MPVKRAALILKEFERQGLAVKDDVGRWTLTVNGQPFGAAAGALAPLDHDERLTYRPQQGTGS